MVALVLSRCDLAKTHLQTAKPWYVLVREADEPKDTVVDLANRFEQNSGKVDHPTDQAVFSAPMDQPSALLTNVGVMHSTPVLMIPVSRIVTQSLRVDRQVVRSPPVAGLRSRSAPSLVLIRPRQSQCGWMSNCLSPSI
jgi:hypothetical protein